METDISIDIILLQLHGKRSGINEKLPGQVLLT
jgi:hypothetical protein